jgi:hypothetical protein
MKEFTSEEIQAQFEKLPTEVQAAVSSTDVNNKIEAISQRHGLHMDQLSELVDEIGLIMMGLRKSSLFTSDLCSRLSVDRTVAQKIAQDVGNEIFSAIKKQLMELQRNIVDSAEGSVTENQNSDFQSIGGFTVEPSPMTARQQSEETTIENKPDLIKSIENPEPAPKSFVASNKIGTDPLVDHLLTTPVTVPPQIIERPVNGASQTAPKSSGPDPYREATS